MIEKQRKTDHMNEALITGLDSHDHSERSPLLIESYRGELLLHCYRLLGSSHDAEDAVQETILRAWRHSATFTDRGPGSLRSWLYTIATNTSLDMLKKRVPRILPTATFPVSDPSQPVAPRNTETLWLEPFPDSWFAEATENPEVRYTRSESVSLAFLTALQLLPPRGRAILILSDVLSFRASEIALLLEISVSAVNSALHRARVMLEKNYAGSHQNMLPAGHIDTATKTLLSRYLRAWETDDVAGLITLLKEDATLSMPPVPSWYQGREAIRSILLAVLFPIGIRNRWRLLPTQANGQPAFAVYRADEESGVYQAFALQVLTLDSVPRDPVQISAVTAFLGPKLVTSFGFPSHLPH